MNILKKVMCVVVMATLLCLPAMASAEKKLLFKSKKIELVAENGAKVVCVKQEYTSNMDRIYILHLYPNDFEGMQQYAVLVDKDFNIQGYVGALIIRYPNSEYSDTVSITMNEGMAIMIRYLIECMCHSVEWTPHYLEVPDEN